MQQSVLRTLNAKQIAITEFGVRAPVLAKLLKKVLAKEFNTTRGREILEQMLATGNDLDAVMQELGIEKIDEGDLSALCQELLDANPQVVADLKEGKMKAVGALIGQAKQKNPNVDPNRVREICVELAGAM